MRRGLSSLTQYLVRRALSRAVGTIGLDVQAVVSAWTSLDIFGVCDERLRVWWAQDDYSAGADLMGIVAGRVAADERARIRQSDFIIAATPEIDRCMRSDGYEVELIANGADLGSFSGVGETVTGPPVDLEPPIAVLVGQLNDRIDPALLEAVLDRDVSLLIVGPAVEGQAEWLPRLCSRPNVKWLGRQPFDALPGLLGQASVGLVPYADTAFNRASFPLKALEYLAAGLPSWPPICPSRGGSEPGQAWSASPTSRGRSPTRWRMRPQRLQRPRRGRPGVPLLATILTSRGPRTCWAPSRGAQRRPVPPDAGAGPDPARRRRNGSLGLDKSSRGGREKAAGGDVVCV